MPILTPTKLAGTVTYLGVNRDRDATLESAGFFYMRWLIR